MYKVLVDGALFVDSRLDELTIINPVVNLEVNTVGSFTFTIPPEHPRYNLIQRRKSIISVFRDDETEPIFQGVCVEEEIDFFKQKKITCEGELTYFNDSVQRPARYQGVTVLELLTHYINNHNAQVEDSKKFTVGTVTVNGQNLFRYTNMESTMTEIKEDLIDDYGGYIRVRYADGKKYIDYLADSPRVSNQLIELGKNLIDYKSNIDDTDIATVIIPLGATLEAQAIEGLDTKLTIESVNDGKDFLQSTSAISTYGVIQKVVEWDDVTTPSALKEKGQEYLNNIQFENVVIEASAVDMGMLSERFNRFKLLDSIHVISEPHGMDRYFTLTKLTLNLAEPDKDTITLGEEKRMSLSAQTNSANAEILKAIANGVTSSKLKQAIDSATSQITGAEGGYVKINYDENNNPYEILVMDKPEIEQAEKIWRWNQNGLGYSSTGYDGTYALAMTQDGGIVADFITTGTLSTDRLSGDISADSDVTIAWDNVTNQPSIPTAAQMTQITKDTVTTSYVNALGVKAGSVDCENLTGTTISGKTISGGTISGMTIKGSTFSGNGVSCSSLSVGSGGISNSGSMNMTGGINSCAYIDCSGDVTSHGKIVPRWSGSGGAVTTFSVLNSGTPYLEVRTSGAAYGATLWSSDTKLKKNVSDTEIESALEIIDQIKHRQFDWKENNVHQKLGYLANELVEVIPDAVFEVVQPEESEFDTLKNINPTIIIPYLTKAIQELYGIIKRQGSRIAELEEK